MISSLKEVLACFDSGLVTAGQAANQLVDVCLSQDHDSLGMYKVTCKYLRREIAPIEYLSGMREFNK